jgi:hypothetical protein
VTITIRITVELDVESAAKVLMLAGLPDAPSVAADKAAMAAVRPQTASTGRCAATETSDTAWPAPTKPTRTTRRWRPVGCLLSGSTRR